MYSQTKRQKNNLIDDRILAIHRAIAKKVIAQPLFIMQAKKVLEKRYEQKLIRYGSYLLWQSLLELEEPEVFSAQLLSVEPRWYALRRSTIFVGVLTEEERKDALSE
ncbi:hypothetical protein [Aestuariibacter sp. A3R04]|uniref:hypothetical protein n=1 Tax=Aestuariibacter sp. A3R04 TaxID=2841571 RepID=UPI001C099F27|nr:hypothetical protein [Aestuariibacter sp. A3R04]MBU3022484.1 hypothetical protein [Aestuariibacter sp. A3R04]